MVKPIEVVRTETGLCFWFVDPHQAVDWVKATVENLAKDRTHQIEGEEKRLDLCQSHARAQMVLWTIAWGMRNGEMLACAHYDGRSAVSLL